MYRNRSRGFFIIAAMAAALALIIFQGGPLRAQTDEMYKKLKVFSDVLSIIQKNYVEETKPEDLIYGAINGMLRTLDPHSSFMMPDMYKELQVETKGSFGGIGIEISMKKNILTIVSPIEDTPAYRAGLKAEDKILSIDGESTENMTLIDAVKKMRGPAGTKVTISIIREGFFEPRDFALVRETIRIKSVKYRRLEDDTIGYIRLSQFQEKTGEEFDKALKDLEGGAKPIQGLVLDLRNNPGGLLDQAVTVCDTFLEDGLIVYTQGRLSGQDMRFTAHPDDDKRDYPIIVLVNAGSASGSEIVAGALQDRHRAVVLGTTTFGKASVQTIIPLDDGSGLRLTTALYYTPSGRSIQATGIVPDVIVKDRAASASNDKKTMPVIKEKDLKGHFEPAEKPADAGTPELKKPDQGQGQEPAPEPELEPEPDREQEGMEKGGDEEDPQLTRATQLLKSWNIFKKIDTQTPPAKARS
jgi:carboxyl-terminal processing protease